MNKIEKKFVKHFMEAIAFMAGAEGHVYTNQVQS